MNELLFQKHSHITILVDDTVHNLIQSLQTSITHTDDADILCKSTPQNRVSVISDKRHKLNHTINIYNVAPITNYKFI